MSRVLVVDDEPGVSFTLSEILKLDGFDVLTAAEATEALALLVENSVDVVISDIILPKISGIDLMSRIQEKYPEVEVILMTGEPTVASATEAMRAGAVDYLAKPVSGDTVHKAVANALEVQRLKSENRRLTEELRRHGDHLQEQVEARTAELEAYSRRLRYIADRTKAFATMTDIEELVAAILTLLAEDTEAQGGSFYLRDGQEIKLIDALDGGHQAETLDPAALAGSVIGRVLEQGSPLLVRDINGDETLQSSGWAGYRDASLLALPLLDSRGAVEGIALLHSKRRPPFTEQDLELGCMIVGHGMEALTSARLTYSLAESEQRHRALVENAPLGIMSIDRDGQILDLNPALLEILGSPSAEATRRVNVLTFEPIVRSGIADVFRSCFKTGRRLSFEGPYQSKWGKKIRARVTVAPIIALGDQVIGVEAIIDTMEEKEPCQES